MSSSRHGTQTAGESSANHIPGGEAPATGDEDDPVVQHAYEDMLDTHPRGDLGSGLTAP
jgi:hypothetical protein